MVCRINLARADLNHRPRNRFLMLSLENRQGVGKVFADALISQEPFNPDNAIDRFFWLARESPESTTSIWRFSS